MGDATISYSSPAARPGSSLPLLALQWVDGDLLPRFLVNGALEMVWANPAAQRHFRERRGIECHRGLVVTTDPGCQAAFCEFVLGCAEGAISTFCLSVEEGGGFLLFRGRKVGSIGGERFFGIAFHRSDSHSGSRYADLDVAFQLTPSELRVIETMSDGHTADEISASLGVSIETVRSHLKHIYAKLDVTSREGLFSRILPFRV